MKHINGMGAAMEGTAKLRGVFFTEKEQSDFDKNEKLLGIKTNYRLRDEQTDGSDAYSCAKCGRMKMNGCFVPHRFRFLNVNAATCDYFKFDMEM